MGWLVAWILGCLLICMTLVAAVNAGRYRLEAVRHTATRKTLADTQRQLRETRVREQESWRLFAEERNRSRFFNEPRGMQDFSHVTLAYPADALPDIPTSPLDDDADAWVAEMRERWLSDDTSEQ